MRFVVIFIINLLIQTFPIPAKEVVGVRVVLDHLCQLSLSALKEKVAVIPSDRNQFLSEHLIPGIASKSIRISASHVPFVRTYYSEDNPNQSSSREDQRLISELIKGVTALPPIYNITLRVPSTSSKKVMETTKSLYPEFFFFLIENFPKGPFFDLLFLPLHFCNQTSPKGFHPFPKLALWLLWPPVVGAPRYIFGIQLGWVILSTMVAVSVAGVRAAFVAPQFNKWIADLESKSFSMATKTPFRFISTALTEEEFNLIRNKMFNQSQHEDLRALKSDKLKVEYKNWWAKLRSRWGMIKRPYRLKIIEWIDPDTSDYFIEVVVDKPN